MSMLKILLHKYNVAVDANQELKNDAPENNQSIRTIAS